MFAATALLRPEAGGTAYVEILWRHSVAVAVAAGGLSGRKPVNPVGRGSLPDCWQ